MRHAIFALVFSASVFGQIRAAQSTLTTANLVPDERRTARIIASVPMIGTGKADDPIRPMFVPSPKELMALAPRTDGRPAGILVSNYVLSDDKKSAIVDFGESDRATMAPILNSTDPRVKVFERGVNTRAAIEAEFQKIKAGFTIESLGPGRFAPALTRTVTPVRGQQ